MDCIGVAFSHEGQAGCTYIFEGGAGHGGCTRRLAWELPSLAGWASTPMEMHEKAHTLVVA